MVCSIDWNPTQQDEIAFIKQDGYWGTVANFLKDAPIKTATAVPQTEKNVCTYLFLIFFYVDINYIVYLQSREQKHALLFRKSSLGVPQTETCFYS